MRCLHQNHWIGPHWIAPRGNATTWGGGALTTIPIYLRRAANHGVGTSAGFGGFEGRIQRGGGTTYHRGAVIGGGGGGALSGTGASGGGGGGGGGGAFAITKKRSLFPILTWTTMATREQSLSCQVISGQPLWVQSAVNRYGSNQRSTASMYEVQSSLPPADNRYHQRITATTSG